MAPGGLRTVAALYALGVALVCPAVLSATEGQPPNLADAQADLAAATAPPTAEPSRAKESTAPDPPAPSTGARSQVLGPAGGAAKQGSGGAPQTAPGEAAAPPAAVALAKAQVAGAGSVTMKDFSFSPASLSIKAGDSVSWTNRGKEPHTATGDGFDTGVVKPGGSGSARFPRAGSFPYVCSIHPSMRGTVRVASTAGGGDADRGTDPSAGSEPKGEPAPSSRPSVAGQASRTRAADTNDSGRPALASTGLNAWLLASLGVALLAIAIGLRRHISQGYRASRLP